ncbi:hypothetical protein OHC33_010270 [Knufia fluminis]|uniref:Uncharacterized protein n=1 Tax=Knufia fluminis TaxID=191047 RepID=A0AAN8II19_9EURO|nr:hypothetical protein OHC33_010270 [Knufia fluminis]
MPALGSQLPLGERSWRQAYEWSPFKLDALGLITLLGTPEVDQAIGQLTDNTWCEYLPFLAANVVAADSFTKPSPGYQLFNITDGIRALDLNGWFTRWLEQQDLQYVTTVIEVRR